jgi:hypothetical protein
MYWFVVAQLFGDVVDGFVAQMPRNVIDIKQDKHCQYGSADDETKK